MCTTYIVTMHPRPLVSSFGQIVSFTYIRLFFLFLVSIFGFCLYLTVLCIHAAILSSYLYFLISHPFNPLFISIYPSCSLIRFLYHLYVYRIYIYGQSVPFTSHPYPLTMPLYSFPNPNLIHTSLNEIFPFLPTPL